MSQQRAKGYWLLIEMPIFVCFEGGTTKDCCEVDKTHTTKQTTYTRSHSEVHSGRRSWTKTNGETLATRFQPTQGAHTKFPTRILHYSWFLVDRQRKWLNVIGAKCIRKKKSKIRTKLEKNNFERIKLQFVWANIDNKSVFAKQQRHNTEKVKERKQKERTNGYKTINSFTEQALKKSSKQILYKSIHTCFNEKPKNNEIKWI